MLLNLAGGKLISHRKICLVLRAYKIENSKITKPLKEATLIGNGPRYFEASFNGW